MHGLPHDLLTLLPPADWSAQGKRPELPAGVGAYLLAIALTKPISINRPGPAILPAGWYLYAGSARGPGGLAGRISRHLRGPEKIHWHVDQLTGQAAGLTALAYGAQAECHLLQKLAQHGAFRSPVPGFGSSDCAACAAHLMMWTGAPPQV